MGWSFHPHRLMLARPYRWARGTHFHRDVLLVRYDAGDAVGWGEVALPPDAPFDAPRLVEAAQRLVALAEPDVPAWLDRQEAPARLRCGITTAWFDAAARRAGRSLARHLAPDHAPPRSSVATNVLLTAQGPETLEREAAEAVAAGHVALKLKVHGKQADVARAQAVRRGAPEAELRLDANGSWLRPEEAVSEALERMAAFSDLDISYVEQPVPPEREDALALLSEAGPYSVGLDESATDAAALGRLLAAGIGAVAILKPQRLGGLDRTLQAMAVAQAHGARTIVTNSLESSIGLHAALHVASLLPVDEACGLGTASYVRRDVAQAPTSQAGRLHVPGPGLGVAPVEVP